MQVTLSIQYSSMGSDCEIPRCRLIHFWTGGGRLLPPPRKTCAAEKFQLPLPSLDAVKIGQRSIYDSPRKPDTWHDNYAAIIQYLPPGNLRSWKFLSYLQQTRLFVIRHANLRTTQRRKNTYWPCLSPVRGFYCAYWRLLHVISCLSALSLPWWWETRLPRSLGFSPDDVCLVWLLIPLQMVQM